MDNDKNEKIIQLPLIVQPIIQKHILYNKQRDKELDLEKQNFMKSFYIKSKEAFSNNIMETFPAEKKYKAIRLETKTVYQNTTNLNTMNTEESQNIIVNNRFYSLNGSPEKIKVIKTPKNN